MWEIGEKVIIRGGQYDQPATVFSIQGTRGRVRYGNHYSGEDFVLKSGKQHRDRGRRKTA